MVPKASSTSQIPKCCGRHENTNEVRDRISELTNDILVHILSSIPTTDVVRTSILSKRWRNVWTFVRVLDIQDRSFWIRNCGIHNVPSIKASFMNFVERLLLRSLNEVSCLQKLRLSCCNDYDMSRVRKWINVVTMLANVEELDLNFSATQHVELPLSIFTCKKLVVLKLTNNILLNVPSLVCLPSLKDLHLVSVTTLDIDSVHSLLAGCPVLEQFYIERSDDKMHMMTLYVQSSSLKRLTVKSAGYAFDDVRRLSRMVIDASNLELLDLTLHLEEQIDVVSSLSSLVRVKLDLDNNHSKSTQGYGIRVLELLRKMSTTKFLYLSSRAIESLEQEQGCLDNLPMFWNLTHLEVGTRYCIWSSLPFLIESSPNLISIVQHKDILSRVGYMCHLQSRTPECSMLYLEELKLTMIHGCENQMEMVSYFLKNAPVLKKMSLIFHFLKTREVSRLHDEVFMLTKASTGCEIEIFGSYFYKNTIKKLTQSYRRE